MHHDEENTRSGEVGVDTRMACFYQSIFGFLIILNAPRAPMLSRSRTAVHVCSSPPSHTQLRIPNFRSGLICDCIKSGLCSHTQLSKWIGLGCEHNPAPSESARGAPAHRQREMKKPGGHVVYSVWIICLCLG